MVCPVGEFIYFPKIPKFWSLNISQFVLVTQTVLDVSKSVDLPPPYYVINIGIRSTRKHQRSGAEQEVPWATIVSCRDDRSCTALTAAASSNIFVTLTYLKIKIPSSIWQYLTGRRQSAPFAERLCLTCPASVISPRCREKASTGTELIHSGRCVSVKPPIPQHYSPFWFGDTFGLLIFCFFSF